MSRWWWFGVVLMLGNLASAINMLFQADLFLFLLGVGSTVFIALPLFDSYREAKGGASE